MKRLVFPTLLVTMVLCDPCFAGTKVLLPIFLDQPVHGALESVWTSQLSMHNSGTSSEGIETCSASLTIPLPACPGVVTPDMELEPGETQHVLPHFSPQPIGSAPCRLITVVPGDIDQIELNLRVADTSRRALNAGTEIPVVRQKDFRTTTLRLLNIPVAPLFRLTFRLYQVSSGSGDYTLRLFDEATRTLLAPLLFTSSRPMTGACRSSPDICSSAT